MKEFKVGDKVVCTVRGQYGKIATVSRVMKTFVELDDGSKWKHTGSIVGSGPWDTNSIVPLTPDVSKERNHQILVRKARAHIERLTRSRDESIVIQTYQLTKHLIESEEVSRG